MKPMQMTRHRDCPILANRDRYKAEVTGKVFILEELYRGVSVGATLIEGRIIFGNYIKVS